MMLQRRPAEESAPTGRRIAEIRHEVECEILAQRERADLAADAFRHSLQSIRSRVQETFSNREKLGGLKEQLKELETDTRKTLAVKTGKEAKMTALVESLSIATSRTEQVKKMVIGQIRKKDECASIIQEHSNDVLEEKSNQQLNELKSLEEAIAWYRKVLGFQVVGGEGVKFIFNKLSLMNPDVEYSFSIRLDNDIYRLLHSNPLLEGINGLVQDLNKTNDLFKFVRMMREKFKLAALDGLLSIPTSVLRDLDSITISSPPVSFNSRSEISVQRDDSSGKVKLNPSAIPSPKSFSGCRPSPRLRKACFFPLYISGPFLGKKTYLRISICWFHFYILTLPISPSGASVKVIMDSMSKCLLFICRAPRLLHLLRTCIW